MQNNNKNDFSNLMHPKIIDADKSGKDLWAIIKLDNDFPPFLMPHPNQRIVDLEKTARWLKVNYLFRQQLNNPENKTEISLYKLENCNSLERPQLILTSNSPLIEVNKTPGEIFQVSVQPHSATKAGETYWSEPFKVIGQQITFCGQKSGPISPRNLSVEVGANGRKVELRWQADGDVRYFEIEKSFNGTFFSPLTYIDGQKRDIDMGSLLNSNTQYLRIRSCNDWACSPWNTLHNK
jgi:hypothetical protein